MRTLDEIKIAAALDAPDFADMVRRALLDTNIAVGTELHARAASLTTFARCVYAMAIREARDAATSVGHNAGSRTTLQFAAALEDFAQSIDPQRPSPDPRKAG